MRIVHHSWRSRNGQPQGEVEGLPAFARPLGLDFIIDRSGKPVLVELQHGFGRRGLLELFPEVNRRYRKLFWKLRRQYGPCPQLVDQLSRICGDKIRTYKLFSQYQPTSLVYRRWSAVVERWCQGLTDPLVLVKPPRGSCGKGILLVERSQLRQTLDQATLSLPVLLQAFVPCQPWLDLQQQPRVACIRHIVLLVSDGQRLSFVHLPSYWRVAPASYANQRSKDTLTANISRGAFATPVAAQERGLLEPLAESICRQLVGHIFSMPQVPRGTSEEIAPQTLLSPLAVESSPDPGLRPRKVLPAD